MGMFEDGLDEGMRETRALMEKEGISYEAASEAVRSRSANAPNRRAFQRELNDARQVLDGIRFRRTALDTDALYTLERINEIKRAAYAAGETVK